MRLAIPKGHLFAGVLGILGKAGITFDIPKRNYKPTCSEPDIQAKLVVARAVPLLIGLGQFQAGFCGRDLLYEAQDEKLVSLLDLGLNPVHLVVAQNRSGQDFLKNLPDRPLVIATEYERSASDWAFRRGLAHIIIQTWGSTEGYLPEDADLIVDCVETGLTLEANNLAVVEELCDSTTQFVTRRDFAELPEVQSLANRLSAAMKGGKT